MDRLELYFISTDVRSESKTNTFLLLIKCHQASSHIYIRNISFLPDLFILHVFRGEKREGSPVDNIPKILILLIKVKSHRNYEDHHQGFSDGKKNKMWDLIKTQKLGTVEEKIKLFGCYHELSRLSMCHSLLSTNHTLSLRIEDFTVGFLILTLL